MYFGSGSLRFRTSLVEKVMQAKHSGMCESQTPCGVQTQPPESLAGGASR
jgi:hypothetical protein